MREELVGVGEVSLLEKVGSLATQLRRRVSSGHHQTLGVQVELSPEEQFERFLPRGSLSAGRWSMLIEQAFDQPWQAARSTVATASSHSSPGEILF